MSCGALDIETVARSLAKQGLNVRFGPFVTRIRSNASDIPAHLRKIYAHHKVTPEDWAESTVAVRIARDKHRPWRRLAQLLIDERPFMPPLAARLAVPMLEWGLNWVIASRAHQFLLVHAAALERNGKVVIMTATSGSGKSTLCAMLAARGWRMFSDEFAVVRLGDGAVLPMPRAISLKNDSIALAKTVFPGGVFTGDFTHTVKGTLAFMRAPEHAVAHDQFDAPPGLIVFPRYDSSKDLEVEAVGKAEAHSGIVTNSMNYAALGERGFTCVAGMVEVAPGWRVSYGNSARMLDWLESAAASFR